MDSRKVIVMLAILAAAMVAAVVLLLYQSALPVRSHVWIGIAGGVGALILLITIVMIARRRYTVQTQAVIDDVCAAHGLTYEKKTKEKLHQQYAPLPGVPKSGNCSAVYRGELDGRELVIFEHLYMVYTGQTTVPIYHAVFVTSGPGWPEVTLKRRGFFSRMLMRLGWRRGLELEDEQFNAALKVRCSDEDFAILLLGPEMQRFMRSKAKVLWAIGAGRVAMVYTGRIKPERVNASLERLRAFWALVPEELEEWGGG